MEWWQAIKYHSEDGTVDINEHGLCMKREQYELALGVVEGRPVWEGDKIYSAQGVCFYASCKEELDGCSWNPPKPKTVMVELLVNDAEIFADCYAEMPGTVHKNIAEACRKAL